MTTQRAGRAIKGRLTTCERCRRKIVWGRTVASDTSRGGKPMPLDPVEDVAGNVAVPLNPPGGLTVRPLKGDERPIDGEEMRAMPHFATCTPIPVTPAVLPDNVIHFDPSRPRRPSKGPR